MSKRLRHPKPDANQAQVIQELGTYGLIVHNVSSLGGDALDLFVGGYSRKWDRGCWVQVELKSEGGQLTSGESDYIDRTSIMVPIIVAYSALEIAQWFGWEVVDAST